MSIPETQKLPLSDNANPDTQPIGQQPSLTQTSQHLPCKPCEVILKAVIQVSAAGCCLHLTAIKQWYVPLLICWLYGQWWCDRTRERTSALQTKRTCPAAAYTQIKYNQYQFAAKPGQCWRFFEKLHNDDVHLRNVCRSGSLCVSAESEMNWPLTQLHVSYWTACNEVTSKSSVSGHPPVGRTTSREPR